MSVTEDNDNEMALLRAVHRHIEDRVGNVRKEAEAAAERAVATARETVERQTARIERDVADLVAPAVRMGDVQRAQVTQLHEQHVANVRGHLAAIINGADDLAVFEQELG